MSKQILIVRADCVLSKYTPQLINCLTILLVTLLSGVCAAANLFQLFL
jgi:hypothetical protein